MENPPLKSLYQQLILEHYRKPKNKADLPDRTVEVRMTNPVCGDEIVLQLKIEGDEIRTARFAGRQNTNSGTLESLHQKPGLRRFSSTLSAL